MSGKSFEFGNKIVNLTLGAVPYTPPATVYLALLTEPFDIGGVGGQEIPFTGGSGYVRLGVANNITEWPLAHQGIKSNANQQEFVAAITEWGYVVGLAIYDSPTGGTLMYFGNLERAVRVTPGDRVQIPAGALQVVEA